MSFLRLHLPVAIQEMISKDMGLPVFDLGMIHCLCLHIGAE